MNQICLTDAELYDITGKVKWSAQRRRLDGLGYKYDLRDDGKPIVLRSYIEATSSKECRVEPDWSALDAS